MSSKMKSKFILMATCLSNSLHVSFPSTQYLAYETQLIFGGKKYEYSPEDYVVATIQLYVDIVNIFVFILSIIGGGNKG